jgi:hypothetical protein
MSNANPRPSPLRTHALAVLLLLLASCATGGGMLAGKADWSTLYRGEGSVETRVLNESSEAITVRILDQTDNVIAQAPLGAHESQTLELPTGTVRTTVRVMRDGHASYTDPEPRQVEKAGAQWRFSAPSIE